VTRGADTVVDWTACTNPKPIDLAGAADGDYRVAVRARDAAGNVSATQTSDYELDATPPAVPTVTAAPASEDVDRSPTWSFAGEKEAVFSCSLTRGTEVVSAESSCAGTKTYNLSGAKPGTYTFTVEATDAAGNESPVRTAQYTLAAAPKAGPGTGGGSGSPGSGSGDLTRGGDAGSGDGTGAADGTAGSGSESGSGSPTTAGPGQPTGSGGTRIPASSPTTRDGANGAGAPAPGTSAASPAGDRAAGATPGSDGPRTARSNAAAGGSPATGDRDTDRSARGMTDKVGDAVGRAGRGTARALTGDVGKAVFPVTLLLILGGFLLVQSRIDRDEPKLAMAPIDSEPDLEFGPPPTRR
jgi:hypothetical protein